MGLIEDIKHVATYFNFEGKILNIVPHGKGHINKTFLIETTLKKYIFQVINSDAFSDVEQLMNKIQYVTDYIKSRGGNTLEVIPTCFNDSYILKDGYFYRMYNFVENTICYERITDIESARRTGKAFGELHVLLNGIEVSRLGDELGSFHNTQIRYKNFLNAVKSNLFRRAKNAKAEIDYINDHKDKYSTIIDGIADGSISFRVIHNDPKINNILFDKKTNDVKCVIDLDTVMPGSVLYDFGDAIRSLFTGDSEDAVDPNELKVIPEIYEAYLDGYYSKAKSFLNEKEISLLPFSAWLITTELAMRFVEDYLSGDKYFNVTRPKQNLNRARGQIALAKDIEKNMPLLEEITRKIVNKKRS
ncbi:MAG: aminoglycoside phosphotransferase family protein [Bacilli bacterium]|nr:aminoglycoside phosphotransferase family protein [Bacilli bacterium]